MMIERETEMSKKLETLAKIEGFLSVAEMLEDASTDSVVPGICTNEDCDYTEGVEPDQQNGWCPSCEQNSVQSCLVIATLI